MGIRNVLQPELAIKHMYPLNHYMTVSYIGIPQTKIVVLKSMVT